MPNKDDASQFKQWFANMQERYQQYYGGYEDLFQEAFEAGAKQEREACAKVLDDMAEQMIADMEPSTAIAWVRNRAEFIRARGEAT